MTSRARFLLLTSLSLGATLAFACSSSTSAPEAAADAGSGAGDGAVPPADEGDAGAQGADDAASGDDGAVPSLTEKEPNNGASASDFQAVKVPAAIAGAIDPAGDTDVFRASLAAGDFYVWRLEPTGAALSPHFGLIEKDDAVPHFAAKAGKGAVVEQEQFVTMTSDWNAVVRDATNVAGGGAKVGGAGFGYTLTVRKEARASVPVVVGSTTKASLKTPYQVALFALDLNSETALDVDVLAQRKAPASSLDTRLTLFDMSKKVWIATNDDIALDQSDSRLGSDALPPGKYMLVVDAVDAKGTDLSFELKLTAR